MKIGIIGGGQLAVMLAKSAQAMNVQFVFLCPEPIAGLADYGDVIVADYDDLAACAQLANACDVVTYENEQIPLSTAEFFANNGTLHPNAKALAVAQDRLVEKRYMHSVGLSTAPCVPVGTADECQDAAAHFSFPAILKRRTGGYDGKGQAWVDNAESLAEAWASLAQSPCVLEGVVAFEREISMIATRGVDGDTVCYPVSENHHRDGIIRLAIARTNDPMQAQAALVATTLLQGLDYCGTFTVELFECNGELLVNEIAPRVHNSGHWSIEGSHASQFENHIRAMLGEAPQATTVKQSAAMINIIGETPELAALAAEEGVYVHLYGKAARPNRKLGHITVVADAERYQQLVTQALTLVGEQQFSDTLTPRR